MRGLTLAALALALVTVAILLFRSGSSYDLTVEFENASQLVKGNQVKVGGVPIGTVSSVDLGHDFQARIGLEITDDDYKPLHEGTRASILFDSLTSVAGRYVSLTPGPDSAPKLANGTILTLDHSKAAIDPDQVLQTFDARVQRDLRGILRKSPEIFSGEAAKQANAGFAALSPALSQSAALAGELSSDQQSLRTLLRSSAKVVAALASRPEDLDQLTGNALDATSAIAEHSGSLDSALAQLPLTLRRTNTTLVNLRSTIEDLRPLVRDTRPAARPLTQVLQRVHPIVSRARPVVRKLRRTVRRPGTHNDLIDALRGIIPAAKAAIPAFNSTSKTLHLLAPIVTEIRPYTPDLIGLVTGFTGTTSHYYDANGRYVRIAFEGSVFALNGTGSLVPLPQLDGLTGLRRDVLRRCPGAATQQLPDKSNPYFEVAGTCSTADNQR